MTDAQKPGTALVTGASSGLGEAFARELASRGHDLILVARREDILKSFAADWQKQFGVRIEVWPADLSTDEGIAGVADLIAARSDLTLLVNNAGFGHGGTFYQIEVRRQLDMMHIHMVAVAHLTHAVLPQMVGRKRGAIINVASVAAFSVVARSAMYNSTKTWVVAFSRAMAEELRGTRVKIQALCPGFTHTGFHSTEDFRSFDKSLIPAFLWTNADKVVGASLKALGRCKTVYVPGFINKVMATAPRLPFGQTMTRLFTRRKV